MIYTFYSYKGGVGRSMAMANVAEGFYQKGKRVVMVDWDLEAPGLEGFFFPENKVDEIKAKPGLLDILLEYKSKYVKLNREIARASQEIESVSRKLLDKLMQSEPDWQFIEKTLSIYASFRKDDIKSIVAKLNELNKTEVTISGIAGIIQSKVDNTELSDMFSISISDKLQSGKLDIEEVDIYLSSYALLDTEMISLIVEELRVMVNEHSLNNVTLAETLGKYFSPLGYNKEEKSFLSGLTNFENLLVPIHAPSPSEKRGLWLLTAGLRNGANFTAYSRAVQDFNWTDFYSSYRGEDYFNWFREQLQNLADIVLIDSRTGVSEMSGVSTRHLADVIVVVTAPNPQNLSGSTNMIKSFINKEVSDARKGRELKVVVVPSRIDFAESLFRNQFEAKFHLTLDKVYPSGNKNDFWKLGIPYIPYYNYVEEIAVGLSSDPDELVKSGKSRDLGRAYEKLADYLEVGPNTNIAISPYVGAQPYQAKDSSFFSGRSQEIDRMEGIISKHGFLILSGPGGIGKSSILAAGLLPALKKKLETEETPKKIVFIKPEAHPFANLSNAIAAEMMPGKSNEEVKTKADDLFNIFDIKPASFKENIKSVFGEDKHFIIIIDQFEEIFILCTDKSLRNNFINALSAWVTSSEATVILSIRSNYMQSLLDLPSMAAKAKGTILEINELNEKQLREVMTASVNIAKLRFEQDLIERILKDMKESGAKLPVLQEVLKELWKNRSGDSLTHAAYYELGGVKGILVQYYKNISQSFSKQETEVFEKLIDRLVNVNNNPPVRVDLKISDIDENSKQFLQPFINKGLLLVNNTEKPGNETIELAHDNLISNWDLIKNRIRDISYNNNLSKSRVESKLTLIDKAREVMRGGRSQNIVELKSLCKELERHDLFDYATEILLIMMEEEGESGKTHSLKNYQTLAKYIYKDNSLPSSFKFERALNELNTHDDLLSSGKCESLGLAGAIYKRKWQFDHQYSNLVLSQYYYKKGFEQWKLCIKEIAAGKSYDEESNDDGYTAINYAYITELIATDQIEECSQFTGITENIIENIEEAKKVREYILTQFIKGPFNTNPELKQDPYINPWIVATVAEAYFGLHKYDAALKFINQYVKLQELKPWEIRSFSKQLVSVADMQMAQKVIAEEYKRKKTVGSGRLNEITIEINDRQISACINALVYNGTGNFDFEIKKESKVGLALSGGGFRASLFHVGVLASLAENDELKNVEVISCVSGGSIIGAYYYLKLKKLLETKTDFEVTKQDYINIIKEIEIEFLTSVQKNLRMRIFSNLFLNFKMIFNKHYSRSHRIGELYEYWFYKSLSGKKETYMKDLRIEPKLREGETFSFADDNWKRNHKIPQLVLNATSVNTGHNWQFTASWMGEPPGNIQPDVDAKPRLRRMYYQEAPDDYKEFRLGYAVAASACVPVMFEPMPMLNLYPDIELQLIDGGLHDNQGIAALIEQECSGMIISDASGQMPTNETSTNNEAGVFYRADTILQERIRELQFMDIKERNHTSQVNSLISLHLKNGLTAYPVSWLYCRDPERALIYGNDRGSNKDLLKYGILRESQELLSQIRTDLDSFNDIEAYSLMYSGYMQTNFEMVKKGKTLSVENDWKFLQIKDYLIIPSKAEKIKKILRTGKNQAFKALDISIAAKVIFWTFILLLLALLCMPCIPFILDSWDRKIFDIGFTAKEILAFVGIIILGFFIKPLSKYINLKSKWLKYFSLALIAIGAFIVTCVYLFLFNGLYNKSGDIKKLK